MKKFLLLIILFCCSLILSGCVEMIDKVTNPTAKLDLNYKLEKPSKKVYQVRSRQKISVTVKDQRDIPDSKIVFYPNYGDEYYFAEKPIADIIKEGISDGLKQMNFQVTASERTAYHFYCDINGIIPQYNAGFFNVALTVKIISYCYLIDEKNKKILWKETLEGVGVDDDIHQKPLNVRLDENDGGKAFNFALTNLIRNIQNSKVLQSEFDGYKSN